MTQLLFQCFSQSIGRFVRLNRSVSYCRGAHWSSYLFLKLLKADISQNLTFLAGCAFHKRAIIQAGDHTAAGKIAGLLVAEC
jgi:hypothetical protein